MLDRALKLTAPPWHRRRSENFIRAFDNPQVGLFLEYACLLRFYRIRVLPNSTIRYVVVGIIM